MYDIIIIGGGVIGTLIARECSRYCLSIMLIEKENDVGNVTSMANSAIVHSGYDPIPGTNKAKFNVLGNASFPKLCEELDVDFAQKGSLTLAFNDEQVKTLYELKKRAKQNGVEVNILDKNQVLELEPNVNKSVVAALFAPTCGIVNPFSLVAHAFENAIDNGIHYSLGEEVLDIKCLKSSYKIITNKKSYEAKIVINAAGLNSDKIASLVDDIDFSIVPKKGQYFVLDHFDNDFVHRTLFPLPSSVGKGVLVSPTTSLNYIVGPSSEQVESKEDFSSDNETLKMVKKQAISMVENIPFNQVIRTFSGLRASSSTHDFIIEESKFHQGFINVCGIESPGLVSSIAIAKHVVENIVASRINLTKNPNFSPRIKPYTKCKRMSEQERNNLILNNPKFGFIVCNCEKISLGEIEEVLSRNGAPTTLKGVKKRLRTGFGKCQGGFCQSYVVDALAKHFNISKLDVLYDKEGSYILSQKLKGENE